MKEILLLVSALGTIYPIKAAYNFTCVASLPDGIPSGDSYIGAGDTDHDGLNELIFTCYREDIMTHALEIWENTGDNNYELAYMDTANWYYFCGICDMDGDSLSDVVGIIKDTSAYTWWIQVRESPTYNDYPSVLTWEAKDYTQSVGVQLITDFDRDGKSEIWTSSSAWPGPGGLDIYENVEDNKNDLVLEHFPGLGSGIPFPCDDFDGDGKLEIATWRYTYTLPFSVSCVFVFENIGNDTLTEVWTDTLVPDGGHDLFCGKDCDGDGKPEFFVNFQHPTDNGFTNYLIQFEEIGDNLYSKVIIDSFPHWLPGSRHSDCGDVDGDGREEIVWSMGGYVVVLKATSNDKYERIWEWKNDLGEYHDVARALCYDLNKNGYEEMVFSGDYETKIYEYDTTTAIQEPPLTPIRVLSLAPNPFRQTITLSYSLSQAGPVELKVYDISGKLVRNFSKALSREPGVHSIHWDSKDDAGEILPTGVYFLQLKTDTSRQTRKALLIR